MSAYSREELEAKTVVELREILRNEGIIIPGRKADMIDEYLAGRTETSLDHRINAVYYFILDRFTSADFYRMRYERDNLRENDSHDIFLRDFDRYDHFADAQYNELINLEPFMFEFVEQLMHLISTGFIAQTDKDRSETPRTKGFVFYLGTIVLFQPPTPF